MRSIAPMPTFDDAFPAVCAALAQHFGGRPPDFAGLAPFEAMVAVVLERELGSRWNKAVEALSAAGLLCVERLAEADLVTIGDALREHGLAPPPQALAPLKSLARWLVDHHGGRVEPLFDPHRTVEWLRGELAGLVGIGVTTADAIVLFALKRPSYPVDRATYRVLLRHGWLDPDASYVEARELLVDRATETGDLPDDLASAVLADLKGAMAELGRRYCRAAGPRCDGCPLECLLPAGGSRELDA